ncbi:O-antigen polymerase [Bacillus mycoides]|uniref:O-antigen polymerase n=1 Tax=Bacillus mycoides TaxID=1405 RepID=UPI001C01BF45|nr:O-antigen polymerase [Bacillus mycoides]QWG36137.1 oligosaccharide repeat unit polymerase [Bacillus mycoides]
MQKFFQINNYILVISVFIGCFVPIFFMNLGQYFYENSISIIIFITCLVVQQKYNSFMNFMNVVSFFNIFMLFFIFLGVIVSPLYEDVLVISNKTILFLALSYLAFTLGIVIAETNKRKVKFYHKINLSENWKRKESKLVARIFFLIGIFLGLYYFKQVGTVPLLVENADSFRVQAKEGKSMLYLLIVSFIYVASIVRFVSVSKFSVGLIPDICLFFISFLVILGMGYRGQAFYLLLLIFLVYLIRRNKKLNFVAISIFSLVLLSFIAITGYYRSSGSLEIDLLGIYKVTMWRFFVNVYNLETLISGIHSDYMIGKSYIMDFITILPGYQPSSQIYLKDYLGMVFEGGGITYTLFGEFYLNWGFLGGILFSFGFGVMLSLLNTLLGLRKGKITYTNVGFLIIIMYAISAMVGSGIPPALNNILLPYSCVYILALRFIVERRGIEK